MKRNDCLRIVVAQLEAAGITPEIKQAKKHIRIYWHRNGRRHSYTVPLSPSDWRASLNSRSDIRRILRADARQQ
jgi:hypothetical protein